MANGHENPQGSGVLFPARSRPTDRHPHYTGEWRGLDGKTYWLSGWRNESRNGKEYIAIKIGGEKEEQPPKDHAAGPSDDFDDDIPF